MADTFTINITVTEEVAPMVQANPIQSTSGGRLTEQSREDWEINSRLPEFLLPLHYDLYLHPDLQKGTFNGGYKNKKHPESSGQCHAVKCIDNERCKVVKREMR